jgi:hypothetical protein
MLYAMIGNMIWDKKCPLNVYDREFGFLVMKLKHGIDTFTSS